MPKYQRILCATDLSPTCYPVHEKAHNFAKLFGAELFIVHVIEPMPAYGYPGFTDLDAPLLEQAKKEFEKLGDQYGVSTQNQLIEVGSVKNQVLKLAQLHDIDMIIIGSHGRHGLSKILGSSATGIVHGAECDVLTVRTHRNS